MNTPKFVRSVGPQSPASAAFTLLELLVVISIIAVLAGILLPVAGSVQENARKVSAKNTVMQIVTAVKNFQTEYGVYPPPSPGTTGTVANGDTTYLSTTNYTLFGILRATDAAANSPNTRRITYFEGKDAKSTSKPKDGFATMTASTTIGANTFNVPVGTLVDPWGVGYMIRYDTGYDDAVMMPQPDGTTPSTTADSSSSTTAGTTTGVIRSGVIAWSYGKDAVPGTQGNAFNVNTPVYGDDVVSWQ